jgi:predicted DNA-binding transcriptional regulator AlpA
MTKKGFPKPIQISPGRVAWMKSQVDDWIRAKMGLADAPTP